MKVTFLSLTTLVSVATVQAKLDCSSAAFTNILDTLEINVEFAQTQAENTIFTPPKAQGPPKGFPPNGSPKGMGPPKMPFARGPIKVPALCAIQAKVKSSKMSEYSFGLFLPEKWNGRFLAVGNGGFAGSISWADMGSNVANGFAIVSTDAGTRPSAFGDASWAHNNPERVTDWGWRGLHGAVIQGKKLVRQYYGQEIKKAYYMGCSTGGRQGLKEAQMFPDDFDGIVIGAPAWWTVHLQLWNMKVGMYNLPVGAPHHIPAKDFSLIQKEVMKQCDSQDGVADNIISDPRRCKFRSEALLCGQNTTTGCLTVPQLTTLDHLYSDWVEANQTYIFSHLELGSEYQWPMAIGDSVPSGLGTEYVKYMLGLGPNWQWQDFEPSIIKLSEKTNPGNATADMFDMEPFYKRGGKLLHYHGLADGSIAPGASQYFYDQVFRTMQPKGIQLDDFYRFFWVPGMGHCFGSADSKAPAYIGGADQGTGAGSLSNVADSKHNVLLAMIEWVENEKAPTQIIGTAWKNEMVPGEIYRQRPLCMYPKVAEYSGSGDEKKPENWSCRNRY